MIASVSGAVKKAVIIPTVSTVAQMRSSIPDGAFHCMKDVLDTPSGIDATAHSLLDPKPS